MAHLRPARPAKRTTGANTGTAAERAGATGSRRGRGVQRPTWFERDLLCLDLETTGLDTAADRIVELALVRLAADGTVRTDGTINALVEQTDPIPPASTAVHGITTERCRRDGRPVADVLHDVTDALNRGVHDGLPVVIFNARFDWPLLAAECARNDIPPPPEAAILDPLVLDRRLSSLVRSDGGLIGRCRRHGITLERAHCAFDDAVATGRLLQALARAHPLLRVLRLEDLGQLQVRWDRWYRGSAAPVTPWPTALPDRLDRAG